MTRVDDQPVTAPGTDPPLRRPPRSALRLVLLRELRERGRSGAFVITTLLTLLLVVAGIVVPTLLGNSTTTYRVGLVGSASPPIVRTAQALAERDADDVRIESESFADADAAEAAVENGDIDVAVVDGEQLVAATAGGFGGSDVQDFLQRAAATQRIESLVGADRAGDVIGALTSDALDVRVLSGQEADENEGRAIIAYGGLVLTYMVILSYAMWTLNGVTEEKSNRVIELLLATARPSELLAGKILGISVLGLGQFLLTVGVAVIAIRVTGAFELPAVPVDMVGTLILWVVLGFAMYMVMAGAAGALASKTEDAQNAMTPITLAAVGAFFLSFQVLSDPDGIAAVVGTFVPITAPFVVPIRGAFQVLPLWQHLAAVAITLVMIAVVLYLGARVYSGGLLQFGGRLKWREAFRNAEL
jgi:ABC-2 type transport system permease protein